MFPNLGHEFLKHQNMREYLIQKFSDIFTVELGPQDRMVIEPVKLEVQLEGVKPYHCQVATEVPFNFDKEARRMVASMLASGIIKEVSMSTEWFARGFFVGKPGGEGRLRMVMDFRMLNRALNRPSWPFYTSD